MVGICEISIQLSRLAQICDGIFKSVFRESFHSLQVELVFVHKGILAGAEARRRKAEGRRQEAEGRRASSVIRHQSSVNGHLSTMVIFQQWSSFKLEIC